MELVKSIYPEIPADRYKLLVQQMKVLLEGETDWVANLANASALLNGALPNINWVGFYRLVNGELLLGPFQGKTACIHIPFGKGVCGTAAAKNKTQVVEDVHRFEGHIACDSDSASELVIPLCVKDKVVGVLDIDSPVLNRFSDEDARALEEIAELISAGCEWS
ncbi:GAF domain-containing protein [Caproicibacter sp.]|uniref:GAF domain-containing protein n=1 Tax=Caproicibacter sp. TaxID=2814884 RepID=UPI00398A221C